MENESPVKQWTPAVLAVIVALAFLGLLFMLFFRAVPADNRSAFDIVLGLLGGALTAILNYFFGSSVGSAKKDATISTALAAVTPVVPSTTVTTTTIQPQEKP